ncbi:MAG: hypothetical protein ACHQT9_00395 [Candidatus Saccharimonadales bacterium]
MPDSKKTGLVNPEVEPKPDLKNQNVNTQPAEQKYKTHIPEPRWQQIISVVVILILIIIWLLIFTRKL